MPAISTPFYFSASLGDLEDFIDDGDLVYFKMLEEAGNTLPKFTICFDVKDDSILPYLNEGNILRVDFGTQEDDAITTEFMLGPYSAVDIGANKIRISVSGYYNAIRYVSTPRRAIFGTLDQPLSAVEVIKQVAKNSFFVEDTDFNIEASDDLMIWVQPNQSDRKFINDCWMHADLGESFPVVGITYDGHFRLFDFKELISQPPKYNLTSQPDPSDQKDILYLPVPRFGGNLATVNNFFGRGRERADYGIEDDSDQDTSEDIVPQTSLSEAIPYSTGTTRRIEAPAPVNENVHPNFWVSHNRNLSRLGALSSIPVVTQFEGFLPDLHICDLVQFRHASIDNTDEVGAFSGVYCVDQLAIEVINKTLTTLLRISRENINNPVVADLVVT